MKFMTCPICDSPLVNQFVPLINKIEILFQSCNKYLDHSIEINSTTNMIHFIKLSTNNKMMPNLCWDFELKDFYIEYKYALKHLEWFVPDFYNFPALLKKVKTYLIFS